MTEPRFPPCSYLSLLATRGTGSCFCSKVRITRMIEKVFPGEISHGPLLPDCVAPLPVVGHPTSLAEPGVGSRNGNGAKRLVDLWWRIFARNLAFFCARQIHHEKGFVTLWGRLEGTAGLLRQETVLWNNTCHFDISGWCSRLRGSQPVGSVWNHWQTLLTRHRLRQPMTPTKRRQGFISDKTSQYPEVLRLRAIKRIIEQKWKF